MRRAVRLGLSILILLAPLPFGAVRPAAVLALELAAALLAACALLARRSDPEPAVRSDRVWALAGAAIVAVGAAQLVPLGAALQHGLVGPTAHARDAIAPILGLAPGAAAPASLSAADSLDALLRLAACLALGWTTTVVVRSAREARPLAVAFAASAALQGAYGGAEYLSGHQHILGYAKEHFLESATGTFINRNHFASFLAAGLPFALILALDARRRLPVGGGWRRRLVALGSPASLELLGAASAVFMIVLGVLLSYSRGGLAAAVVGVAAVAGLGAVRDRRHGLIAALLLAAPVLFLLWREVEPPASRFVASQTELRSLANRVPIWRETIGMIRDYPVLGTGLGTFGPAFRLYQSAESFGRVEHAHSEWLQVPAEGGLALVGALALGTWLLLRSGRRSARAAWPDPLRSAAVASAAAVLVHAVIDFPLRIPAIGAALSIALGMVTASRGWSRRTKRRVDGDPATRVHVPA